MKTFSDVASLKLAKLKEGQFVETGGYYTKGGGGGAKYFIETPAQYGGTPDGYGDHTLANGNIAKLVKEGVIKLPQYGATSNDGAIAALAVQACFNALSEFNTGQSMNVSDLFSCGGVVIDGEGLEYHLSNGILPPDGLGNYKVINMELVATDDYPLDKYMIAFTPVGAQTRFENVTLDGIGIFGNRRANGIHIDACTYIRIEKCNLIEFKSNGIKTADEGAKGGSFEIMINNCEIKGYYFEDRIVPTGEYPASCIEINNTDNEITNCIVHTAIHPIIDNLGSNRYSNIHIYNADGLNVVGVLPVGFKSNAVDIELNQVYFDGVRLELNGAPSNITVSQCNFLNSRTDVSVGTASSISLRPTSNNTDPVGLKIVNNNFTTLNSSTKASAILLDSSGGGTFATNAFWVDCQVSKNSFENVEPIVFNDWVSIDIPAYHAGSVNIVDVHIDKICPKNLFTVRNITLSAVQQNTSAEPIATPSTVTMLAGPTVSSNDIQVQFSEPFFLGYLSIYIGGGRLSPSGLITKVS